MFGVAGGVQGGRQGPSRVNNPGHFKDVGGNPCQRLALFSGPGFTPNQMNHSVKHVMSDSVSHILF